jgi:hypothetical protein
MIWFSCSNCHKTLGRPESSAGAFVFCDCGQGLVVPWDSTAPPPAGPPPLETLPPQPPPLAAVPVGEEKIPVARRPSPAPSPPPLPDWGEDESRRRVSAPQHRNPGQCFNHQDRPVKHKCADCQEGFCDDCVVQFQGKTLCGPCKNFRLRRTDRAVNLSAKALTALIVAIGAAPAVACLWPLGLNALAVLAALVALLAQLGAVLLGALALYDTERNPRLAGKALAITGVLTGAVASVLTVFFIIFGPR